MLDYALLLFGGVLLYFGAEWLVSGASRLALALRIPPLLVGLTVVAYGTSTPEVIVGVEAAAAGHGDVALGNVLGSNIANFGLILGASALFRPARVDGALRRRELPVLLGATCLVPLTFLDGRLSMVESLGLLAVAGVYTVWMVRSVSRPSTVQRSTKEASTIASSTEAAVGMDDGSCSAVVTGNRLRHAVVAAVGLVVLLVGGKLFVSAATDLARAWGMSERLVGLTIVAVGTSLPELATSLLAAARGNSDIAVGNVVGSNIFNILLCLGASGLSGAVEGQLSTLRVDLVALFLMTGAGLVFIRTERTMRRWEGAVLLAGYVVFLVVLAVR